MKKPTHKVLYKMFPITSVCREDIRGYWEEERGKKLEGLPTDDEMKQIARKMADQYCEYGGYWDSLAELTKTYVKGAEDDE